MTAIRIVTVDFYMANPIKDFDPFYSDFRGTAINQVPVIRIFGSSKTGDKTCLHIHGVFPYIYIPYDGIEPINTLMYQIANNLDKAINISLHRASANTQHIFKIKHVSGIPIYGYHHKEHQFLKIYFYNPLIMKRASNLLQEGNILGKMYQPHEAHVPYILQFMIDYNLHGMSFISISNVRYCNDDLNLPKLSTCAVEGDALSEDILNNSDIGTVAANPGILAIWEDEKQRRRNEDEDSLISQGLSMDRTDVPPTITHMTMKAMLTERFASNEASEKNDGNTSVYPAETPDSEDLLDASVTENHISLSQQNYSDISALNDSQTPLDVDEENLFKILKDLKDNVNDIEEDSILTQVTDKNQEESDEEVDMTLPLEQPGDQESSFQIPQLDGGGDIDEEVDSQCLEFGKCQRKKHEIISNANLKKSDNIKVQANFNRKTKHLTSYDGGNDSSSDEEDLKVRKYSQLDILVKTPNRSLSRNQDFLGSNNSPKKRDILSTTLVKESIVCRLKGKPENIMKNLKDNSKSSSQTIEAAKIEEICSPSTELSKSSSSVDVEIPLENTVENSTVCISNNSSDDNSAPITLNDNKEFDDITCLSNHELSTTLIEDTELSDCTIMYNNISQDEANNTLIEQGDSLFNLWKPKQPPPPRKEVEESLAEFNIPLVKHQEPFYSNHKDVTGNMEIGSEVLKISSKTTKDCIEFKSNFAGIYEYRKCMLHMVTTDEDVMNAVVQSYRTNTQCLLTPVSRPPSRKEIENELKTNGNVVIEDVREVKKERVKILMPFSPGRDVDYDNSISLSPCTPITQNSSSGSAPSSQKSESCTPKAKKKKNPKTLCDSVLLNKGLPQEKHQNSCNITGVSLENTYNFKMSLENLQEARSVFEHQYLTTVIVEVHCQTRANLKPDPTIDPIKAIFYLVSNDAPNSSPIEGAIIIGPTRNLNLQIGNIIWTNSEKELFEKFVDVILKYDPDICIGYEIEMQSWGYIVDRGYSLELNMINMLSRIKLANPKFFDDDNNDLKFTGRIVLNLWRLLRHEVALQSYTFESTVYHILHERTPRYSFKDLTFWWEHPTNLYQYKVESYYLYRLRSMVKMLEQLDLIGRTSELARLFGIQFYEVLSRGTQFRVESMMLRSAKPLNYIAVSPSVMQRAKMKAPEFMPLILEPESKMYVDPVIVLDFQSLYPSVIIAYNYCFSTCLGRIEHLGKKEPFEFGATQLKVPPKLAKKLLKKDDLNFSPCGAAFVKSKVRKGVLPRMLEEILATRLMVKKSMKKYKANKTLQRVLHSRQLGLKLIANVTYGYTAANFSGRMPAVELGDSVVSKGRETLYRAIKMVESTPHWGAKVVYGDTDSLFVLIPGRSKEDAFKIGEEIAQAVTDDNPSPVKLKMEKVYQPCILQTKKRYVGYMYESPDQLVPDFDAKGIETVRRDGCPAVSKMLEKSLRILFDTRDVSQVRKYIERQMNKLMSGRISIQDLTFAKEYRGQSGYRPGACVPALELTRKWAATDKRNEPRSGERVPYVIINGPPGLPLIRLVRSPYELLNDSSLRPNEIYYITKVIIPPINRCFTLIGADLNVWFKALPRKQFTYLPTVSPTKRATISQYFNTVSCAVCREQTMEGICAACIENAQKSAVVLQDKILFWEKAYHETKLICQSCSGNINCISLDCPVLYRLEQAKRDMKQVPFTSEIITKYFSNL